SLVRDEAARLVTLAGPGGTGKTRLALEAAGELVSEFGAGVFWVGLALVRDPALVVDTIAQTLGAKQELPAHIGDKQLFGRLDNLPLALELAAARVSVLTPAQILERISQRLDLFRAGRDADPRQQTLRATIAWSSDLLSTDEQRLFARMAVFRGGCTLEAAEQVAGADVAGLQSLVDKSLLRHSEERFW